MPLQAFRMPLMTFVLLILGYFSGYAQLNAFFSASKTGGCSPLIVSFTNRTTGATANAVYHWDLGNGNQSTDQNPGAIYTTEKTYTVTLTVQDRGQSSTSSQTITVFAQPTVQFGVSSPVVCLPTPVTFLDSSTTGSGSITSWYWDFGDGSTSQGYGSTQTHNYAQPQTASVSLTVTSSEGCTSTLQKKNIVTIQPALNIAFSANPLVLCHVTDPVQFTNTSSGPGTLSYQWSFGDGNGSTQTNPSYTYNKKGIYSIQLTATSSVGCTATNTQTNYLNVADFSTDFSFPAKICAFQETGFTAYDSLPATNSTWVLDGSSSYYNYGNPFPLYLALGPGSHTMTLNSTYGACTQSVTKTFNVLPSPSLLGFVIQVDSPCGSPVTVHFKDTTAGAVQWAWDFNNQNSYSFNPQAFTQSPAYTYTSDYTYTIELQVTNSAGCTSEAFKGIDIQKPYANIFLNSSTGAGYTGCQGLTIGFGSFVSTPVAAYHWNFGDGDTSNLPNPVHSFNQAGTFMVTLAFTDVNGCTGFATATVVSNPRLNVAITASANPVCGNTPVTFSIPVNADYNNLTWNFGDGQYGGSGNGRTGQHQYQRDGTYTVTAIFESGGCFDTATATNIVKVLPPFPNISENQNTCAGNRNVVTFADTSYEAQSLTWNFGDGSNPISFTTPQSNLVHSYTQTGTYNVTLTATNGQCTVKDSVSAYVLLKQNPTLSTPAGGICYGDPLSLTLTNMQNNPLLNTGYGYQYSYYNPQFQFGDSSFFYGYYGYIDGWNSPETFNLQGQLLPEKEIRVISTSNYFNCQDTSNFVPLVIKGAIAGFEAMPSKICFSSPVVFTDTSHAIPGDSLTGGIWYFGDGTPSDSGRQVSHAYNSPGYYEVTLTAEDAAGCNLTPYAARQIITVEGPQASFMASGANVALNTTVNFTSTTNDLGGYALSYQWILGDGTISNTCCPSETFGQAGVYTVTLITSDSTTGCSSQAQQFITVRNFNSAFGFTASYIASNQCPPAVVQFTNTSANYTSLSWDFGDGSTANNVVNPSHIYQAPGEYIVTLYVTAPNGVTGTHIDSIFVQEPQATALLTRSAQICIGQSDQLVASAGNTKIYTWDFGDGSVSSTNTDSAAHRYTVAGIYAPQLIVTDSLGCTGSAAANAAITVRPGPNITVTPAQPFACLGGSVVLQATGGVQYAWSPSDGLSADTISDPIAAPISTTSYHLLVTDDIGCQDSTLVTVTVVKPETVSVNPDTSICAGTSTKLQARGVDVYNWIGQTAGLSNTTSPDPLAKPDTTTTYTVTGGDTYGCFVDTATVTVQVLPLPSVSAGPDIDVLAGNPFVIAATGSNDIVGWDWSPADYLSCTDCQQPSSTGVKSIQYKVTVKGQDGCLASDTVNVKVVCEESRVAIPDAFTPNGDGHNDRFVIKGISVVKSLVIFDRWGTKVFERKDFFASDLSSCWDGSFNGSPAPTGIYVYFAEMQCDTGGVFTRKGTVVLIR